MTAVLAIVEVWTDIDPDAKVVLSSLVMSAGVLLGLAGAVRIDRDRRAPVAVATLVFAALAVVMTMWLIWFEPIDPDMLVRVLATTWLWTLAFAVHSLIGLAVLPQPAMWLKLAAPLASYVGTALATSVIFAAFEYEQSVRYSVLTFYILAGLATLAVLILHWLDRSEREEVQRLVLTLESEGVWLESRNGRRFRVSEA